MDNKILPLTRFKGEANAGLSIRDMANKGYLEKASNVNITDSGGVSTRDGYGRIYVPSGTLHSLWATHDAILFREGTALKSFNILTRATTTLSSAFLDHVLPVCYRDVAEKIYLMDGVKAGWVSQGSYTAWSIGTVGERFDHYAGRMFIAFGNQILYSRPFAYSTFDAREYILMDDPITMIEAVRTGIWIGTTAHVYFLGGDTPPFRLSHVLDKGVVKGTSVKFAGAYISENVHNEVVLFTTNSGIFMGGDEGYVTLVNRTPNFKPPKAATGKAFLKREGGLVQYIVFLEDSSSNNEASYLYKSEVNVLLPALTKT
jgi:hypothetical protein